MKSKTKIALLASLILATSCSKNEHSNIKIVGGTKPELQNYYAALTYEGNANGIMCGSSFISKRVLLTAAHCVDSVRGRLQVRVGMGDDSTPDKTLRVESVIVHKEWDPTNTTNDIAMLKVEDYDVATLGVNITPIKWNENKELLDENLNQLLRIVGTGTLTSFGQLSDPILKQTEFPYIPTEACKTALQTVGTRSTIDERNICGGYLDRGATTACTGDSGGPLTVDAEGKRLLVGLTSWGLRNCGQKGAPQVYTRVSTFASWIHENLKILDTPITMEEVGQKLSFFQEANCYNRKFSAKTRIGTATQYVDLTTSFQPQTYDIRTQTVDTAQSLGAVGSCQFSMPTLGTARTSMIQENNQKKFITRSANSIWEANSIEKVEAFTIRCLDANNNVIAASIGSNAKVALTGGTQHTIREIQMPRSAFTDDMITSKCSVNDMSVYYYEVVENEKTFKLLTFQGEKFGKNQDFIYLMNSNTSENFEAPNPDFIGTITTSTPDKGTIEIKNNIAREVELYTWELSCSKAMTLTDLQGKIFQPKSRSIMQNGFPTTVYQHRFEFGQSPHGTIMPGQSIKFEVSSRQALAGISCSINQVPVQIIFN